MTSPSLFIGVVSHTGSRFAVSQGPGGLAAQLEGALTSRGATVTVQINTEDLHDPEALEVTAEVTQESLDAEQRLSWAWQAYLDAGRSTPLGARMGSALRWCRRQWRRLSPPGPAMVTRLLNIELSHIDLLQAGLRSGADWILVLEDDAATQDIEDCAGGLLGLMADAPPTVQYANVSESFSLAELGVEPLLTGAECTWSGSQSRRILRSARPITNTVCAILYRRGFVAELLTWFDQQPLTPVVPIDWKLNQALMDLYDRGVLDSESCWTVTPAPIDQLSMRPDSSS